MAQLLLKKTTVIYIDIYSCNEAMVNLNFYCVVHDYFIIDIVYVDMRFELIVHHLDTRKSHRDPIE